ncbi:hypothetical protein SISNIDRAFT_462276 [Sistotremastrum niveocremeum HHB9708]|uniref:DUF6593 domain-containing protein n=1 Tax=Sistotremastrum niveocremeum HHB9708 TaxID=1314777 RepID=A0A164ZZ80_9AGAM|nr:hypothetical protein SISNIDRAFT_462276 [Sistotremastrum niveocremeum HHB9708]
MENDKSSDRPVDSSVAQTLEENRSAEAPPSYRDSDRTLTLGSGAQPYPLSPVTFTLDLFVEAKDDDISNATLSARDGSELFKVVTYHAIIGEERGAGTIVKDASDRVVGSLFRPYNRSRPDTVSLKGEPSMKCREFFKVGRPFSSNCFPHRVASFEYNGRSYIWRRERRSGTLQLSAYHPPKLSEVGTTTALANFINPSHTTRGYSNLKSLLEIQPATLEWLDILVFGFIVMSIIRERTPVFSFVSLGRDHKKYQFGDD